MSATAVVQFGLAIMPLCHFTSAALISGITSGTVSSMRNALELSTTTQPAAAAIGANSLEILPPALNSAMLMPANESLVNSVTATSAPLKVCFFPIERAEASKISLPTGKLRFSNVLIISTPTAPVAPTIATLGFLFIKRGTILAEKGGVSMSWNTAGTDHLRFQSEQKIIHIATPQSGRAGTPSTRDKSQRRFLRCTT